MLDEKPEVEEVTYYEEIRADIETAVYAYTAFEEMDTALFSKAKQRNINNAKEDCLEIICKGLELIRKGYENNVE